jgi:NADH dehydrogenase
VDVVIGALSYTGRLIAGRLLGAGGEVRTLTGHPGRVSPFGQRVAVAPLRFEDPGALVGALRGADTLYNTYWVRFPRGQVTFARAVENTRTLVAAAENAGVRRIVHISITNPSDTSPYGYFRAKALAEEIVAESSMSHAIVRPTVLFGEGDVFINNIAWLMRRFPVFAIAGTGSYRVRPVYVGDVAELAVTAAGRDGDSVLEAVGPEIYTFEDLVCLIATTIGRRPMTVHLPPLLVLLSARVVGLSVRDVLLTRDELGGLMAELVTTDGPATGTTRLSDWLTTHRKELGQTYASELARHYR